MLQKPSQKEIAQKRWHLVITDNNRYSGTYYVGSLPAERHVNTDRYAYIRITDKKS